MSFPHKKKPAWLNVKPLVSMVLTEPHYAVKYRGGRVFDEKAHAEERSDERLKQWAEAGVNLLLVPFFRGFGAEFEKDEWESVRETAARAHTHGMRVGARVSLGALVPETLLLEERDAHNWLQVSGEGQACLPAGARHAGLARPCYSSEGFLRYMEKVCASALERGADLICFEHLAYSAEPDTCRCPVCVGAFREMLREQYGPKTETARAAGLARFGHNSFAHVRPPSGATCARLAEEALAASPHAQEWSRFKAATVTRALARLSHFVEQRNAECAVGALLDGPGQGEAAHAGGLSVPLLPHLDFVALPATRGDPPGAARLGVRRLVRLFGTVPQFGPTEADTAPATAETSEVLACEDLACGGGASLQFARADSGAVGDEVQMRLSRSLREFCRKHGQDLFGSARPLASVALLRESAPSMAGEGKYAAVRRGAEELLANGHVPFSFVFTEGLDELAQHKAVVVCALECLSDEAAQQLREYARSGGGLLFTGQTGIRDAWGRLRSAPVFAELCPEYPAALRVPYGSGRVAYLPLDLTTLSGGAEAQARADFLAAVRFVAGTLPWSAEAKEGQFIAEAFETSGGAVVHVVNLGPDVPVMGLKITVQRTQAPREIVCLSPFAEAQPVSSFQYDAAAQRLTFEWPEVRRYVAFKIV